MYETYVCRCFCGERLPTVDEIWEPSIPFCAPGFTLNPVDAATFVCPRCSQVWELHAIHDADRHGYCIVAGFYSKPDNMSWEEYEDWLEENGQLLEEKIYEDEPYAEERYYWVPRTAAPKKHIVRGPDILGQERDWEVLG